jgi:hypothetical protein
MEPLFSELSYGYAVTSELASGIYGNTVGYPIFPSLKKEGQAGGGYDVQIPFGSPLFLQFKRAYYMKIKNAKYWAKFNSPYYKMNLMRSKYSMQHELMIHLELSGNEVYYIAPEFYTDKELTDYYTAKTVFNHSALLRPSDIGHLPDDGQHYIAFNHGSAWFCSNEAREIKISFTGGTFREYSGSMSRTSRTKIDAIFFDKIIDNLINIYENTKPDINNAEYLDVYNQSAIDIPSLKIIRNLQKASETYEEKAQTAAFLARACFDSELIIVGERKTD